MPAGKGELASPRGQVSLGELAKESWQKPTKELVRTNERAGKGELARENTTILKLFATYKMDASSPYEDTALILVGGRPGKIYLS